ncbi:hypothetical protein [Pantoea rwandensis]|uniref:Uncharacterized protein n=1 Tax=Pantoea rwandensis TaxID=1076550 RepID=A0ABM5RP83_9GAMM|nr:hypothetical protein [Pantoea rwandensis]AIR87719.1 hypothetical protein LH22_20465 [Pantoea rwandensis]
MKGSELCYPVDQKAFNYGFINDKSVEQPVTFQDKNIALFISYSLTKDDAIKMVAMNKGFEEMVFITENL